MTSRFSRSLVSAFALALLGTLVPRASAQLSVAPSSIDRTVGAGEAATATLSVTNEGADAADFFVRFADPLAPIGGAQARLASVPLQVVPAARMAQQPPPSIVFQPPAVAAAARQAATDSLVYDDGTPLPDSFLGTGDPDAPLFVAQRFSPTAPFTLDGLRVYLTTSFFEEDSPSAGDLSVTVEVYDAPDPNEPTVGTLLAVTEAGLQAGTTGFLEVAIGTPLPFEAGAEFFVVLRLAGAPFPIGIDDRGPSDEPARGLASFTGAPGEWIPNIDYLGDGTTDAFLIRALSGSSASSGWLSATPASGSITPGASAAVTLDLDARRLVAGTYTKTLQVVETASGALTEIPVTLTVTGAGLLTIDRPSADFGEVFVGASASATLSLINAGTASLTLTDAASSDPAFVVRDSALVGTVLPPQSEIVLPLAFAPTAPGTFAGTITVASDANPVEIAVSGKALAAPVVQVTPERLDVALASGDSTSVPLTIGNGGGSALTYAVAFEDPDGTPGDAIDSLLYDDGDARATVLIGRGLNDAPLFAAQRFTADSPFALDAVRLFASTIPSGHDPDRPDSLEFLPLTVTVEVYDAPDPAEPTAGRLLGSARTRIEERVQAFVRVPLPGRIDVTPGASVFVVARFDGVAFPFGLDDAGTGDFLGRGFLSTSGEPGDWHPPTDFRDDGVPDVPLIRALSSDTDGLLLAADPLRGEVAPAADTPLRVTIDARAAERGAYARTLVVRTNDPAQPEVRVPLAIVVEGAAAMPLAEGWNLVSWNVELEDSSPEAALASVWDEVEAVQVYRDGAWITHLPGTEANALERLVPGEAAWVRLRADAHLTMDGLPMPMDALDLASGLNGVAYLPGEADAPGHAFASILSAAESVQSFHGTGVAYVPGVPAVFQTLPAAQPGMGYQVRVTDPVRLDYPLVAAPAPFEGVPTDALVAAEREAGVTPTPAWISVWGSGLADLAPGTLVTAVDPDGVVCGAFRVPTDGALGLMAVYADDPATDRDEGARPGDVITLRTPAGVLTDAISWTAPGAVFEVSGAVVSNENGSDLPTAFALRGNYPNPFNPSTTIAFDLPAAADVALEVFDATGRRVAVLVQGTLPAGTHTATWESSTVASGVYLYTLRADGFQASKTMALLK